MPFLRGTLEILPPLEALVRFHSLPPRRGPRTAAPCRATATWPSRRLRKLLLVHFDNRSAPARILRLNHTRSTCVQPNPRQRHQVSATLEATPTQHRRGDFWEHQQTIEPSQRRRPIESSGGSIDVAALWALVPANPLKCPSRHQLQYYNSSFIRQIRRRRVPLKHIRGPTRTAEPKKITPRTDYG